MPVCQCPIMISAFADNEPRQMIPKTMSISTKDKRQVYPKQAAHRTSVLQAHAVGDLACRITVKMDFHKMGALEKISRDFNPNRMKPPGWILQNTRKVRLLQRASSCKRTCVQVLLLPICTKGVIQTPRHSQIKSPNTPSTRLSSISPPKIPLPEKLSSTKRVTLSSSKLIPADLAVTTIKPGGRVKVILIFQNSTGAIDFQSPVPLCMLRASTLQQFFHQYSQRSGISIEQISTLTFNIVFARNESFELHSWDSADHWRDLKVEIKRLLDDTQAAKHGLNEFKIWVRPEEAALTQTVEDDDDGWDRL
jgi:hypothetical protein